MITFVLLRPPDDGYYRIVKAAIDKHFELEDKGYVEVAAGYYYELQDIMEQMEDKSGILELLSYKNHTLIQTTEECLKEILEINPDFLNDKEFI